MRGTVEGFLVLDSCADRNQEEMETLILRLRLRACECFEVPLVVSAMVVEENALASFNELGIR